MSTQSIEDYIKAIFKLADDDKAVQTSALADRLGIRPSSVSNMMRRLDTLGLITYEPYRGARLTDDGERLARRMIRRHRLIERFLSEALGYPWDEVHEEAERLEHAVSAHFIEALDQLLKRPRTDPHGAPIPGRDGRMQEEQLPTLVELAAGQHGIVRRVRDRDAELLRFYHDVGIKPDAPIAVTAKGTHDGPITVEVGGNTHHVGTVAAAGVFVEVADRRSEAATDSANTHQQTE